MRLVCTAALHDHLHLLDHPVEEDLVGGDVGAAVDARLGMAKEGVMCLLVAQSAVQQNDRVDSEHKLRIEEERAARGREEKVRQVLGHLGEFA